MHLALSGHSCSVFLRPKVLFFEISAALLVLANFTSFFILFTLLLLYLWQVAALIPKCEIEGEIYTNSGDIQSRLMTRALRKIQYTLCRSETLIIFVSYANICHLDSLCRIFFSFPWNLCSLISLPAPAKVSVFFDEECNLSLATSCYKKIPILTSLIPINKCYVILWFGNLNFGCWASICTTVKYSNVQWK